MAMTLREFAERSKGRRENEQRATCAYCGKPLREMKTGSRPTTRGRACSDCYFKEMGRWIAKHPINMPAHKK
jgi:hypothetical protein